MALQPGLDLAQTARSAELSVQHRNQMRFGREPSRLIIRTMRRRQLVKPDPRNLLQHAVKNAILMTHGVALYFVSRTPPDARGRVESTPCSQSRKNLADLSWAWPEHPRLRASVTDGKAWILGRSPAKPEDDEPYC